MNGIAAPNPLTSRPVRRLPLLLLLPACALTACESADGEARAQIQYRTETGPGGEPAIVPLADVSAEIRDGRGRRLVRGEEFTVVAPSFAHSDELPTARTGTLRVEARLDRAGEGPVVLGEVRLDLREDWLWTVTMWFTDGDPTETCFGCIGVESFPLPDGVGRSPADSLWLVWGGNSISAPAVF